MVNLTIDGIKVKAPEGTTILKAAISAGIMIPRLCYLEGINEVSACKVCVVEIQGQDRVVTACTTPVEEGMVVFTNSAKARDIRRTNVELILSQHDCHCATCIRSGNCALQDLSNNLGIYDIPFKKEVADEPWDSDNILIRDSKKCIKCMRCVNVCSKIQGLDVWDVVNTGSRTTIGVTGNIDFKQTDCSLCGQCIINCPVGALSIRNDNPKLNAALDDPNKVVICQVAPSVRTAWAEAFDIPEHLATEKRMAACLKKLGFDYVFDTNFSADVTIWEEANELLERLAHKDEYRWPMFTSCCPGWVSFVTYRYPEFRANLSSTKSPQQIFGAIFKNYFAKKINVAPENICSVSIMPCTSKKRECIQPGQKSSGVADVDFVLTTREIIRQMKASNINPMALKEEEFDSPLGLYTGAGVIFGVTGGVMEAALRTAYKAVMGTEAPNDAFYSVRGFKGRKEASFNLNGTVLKTCTVSTLKQAAAVLEDIKAGKVDYHFVEVMTCPNGCVNGGGQPIHDSVSYVEGRSQILYDLDEKCAIRQSHNNPDVATMYKEYYEKPLSEIAEEELHSNHLKDGNYAK